MKKFLSIMLALVLVLSMATVAFAADYDSKLDVAPYIPLTYTVNNGTAPAETFTFKFEAVSYKNGDGNTVTGAAIPAIADVAISFPALGKDDEGKNAYGYITGIDPDDYALGVYTYKVTEVAGKTAGVTYSNETLYLVLTILRDEDSDKHYVAAMHYETADGENKSTGFTNEYDAGSLSVTKKIEGNMADMDKEFQFQISFKAPANELVNSTINVAYPDGTTGTIAPPVTYEDTDGNTQSGTTIFYINLGHEKTVTFTNIPEGMTYEVTETAENYTSASEFSDTNKTIVANDTDTVTYTNTLDNEIDTGISLDSLPYFLMLAVACIGLFLFVSKKRMAREN